MYEAVLEQDLKQLAENIAADAGDSVALLRHAAEMMRAYDRFLSRLMEMPDYRAKRNQDRMADILAGPLAQAQERGVLHKDLTAGDVLIACRMLGSHWKLDGEVNFDSVFKRRLSLLMKGLAGPHLPAKQKAKRKAEAV